LRKIDLIDHNFRNDIESNVDIKYLKLVDIHVTPHLLVSDELFNYIKNDPDLISKIYEPVYKAYLNIKKQLIDLSKNIELMLAEAHRIGEWETCLELTRRWNNGWKKIGKEAEERMGGAVQKVIANHLKRSVEASKERRIYKAQTNTKLGFTSVNVGLAAVSVVVSILDPSTVSLCVSIYRLAQSLVSLGKQLADMHRSLEKTAKMLRKAVEKVVGRYDEFENQVYKKYKIGGKTEWRLTKPLAGGKTEAYWTTLLHKELETVFGEWIDHVWPDFSSCENLWNQYRGKLADYEVKVSEASQELQKLLKKLDNLEQSVKKHRKSYFEEIKTGPTLLEIMETQDKAAKSVDSLLNTIHKMNKEINESGDKMRDFEETFTKFKTLRSTRDIRKGTKLAKALYRSGWLLIKSTNLSLDLMELPENLGQLSLLCLTLGMTAGKKIALKTPSISGRVLPM
jgi:phage shock protein A